MIAYQLILAGTVFSKAGGSYLKKNNKGDKNMYSIKKKYEDFNGNERERTFHFNINKAEAIKLEISTTGGITNKIQKLVEKQDVPEIGKILDEIVALSYGEPSDDGERFVKSRELTEAFMQTNAYAEIYVQIISSEEEFAKFLKGILPRDVQKQIDEAQIKKEITEIK